MNDQHPPTGDMLVRLFPPGLPRGQAPSSRLATVLMPLSQIVSWVMEQTGTAAREKSIADLQKGLSDAQSQIAANKQAISTAQSDVATLKSSVTTMQGALSTAQGNISALQATVAKHTTDIATNAASYATLADALSRLSASLATLDAREAADIKALTDRFPAPIATSVTLSGVLTVGKQVKAVTSLPTIKKDDRVLVTPRGALPGPYGLGAALAVADGQVQVEVSILAAVTLATPVTIPITLTVLR